MLKNAIDLSTLLRALVYQDAANMLTPHPAISQVHCIDHKWKKPGLLTQASAEWQLLSALRNTSHDLVIHLRSNLVFPNP